MKNKILFGICLYMIFLSGCGKTVSYFEEADRTTEETAVLKEPETEETDTSEAEECCVYVCGAVKNPGVYRLPSGSRIYEAVLLAGGLREDACEDSLNQAEELTDGQMIKILTEEEAGKSSEVSDLENSDSKASVADGRINLNTAKAEELMTLPGIGAAKAQSILSYRDEKGGFSSIEEIMDITGIKEGVYSKIKDYITVN